MNDKPINAAAFIEKSKALQELGYTRDQADRTLADAWWNGELDENMQPMPEPHRSRRSQQ